MCSACSSPPRFLIRTCTSGQGQILLDGWSPPWSWQWLKAHWHRIRTRSNPHRERKNWNALHLHSRTSPQPVPAAVFVFPDGWLCHHQRRTSILDVAIRSLARTLAVADRPIGEETRRGTESCASCDSFEKKRKKKRKRISTVEQYPRPSTHPKTPKSNRSLFQVYSCPFTLWGCIRESESIPLDI